MTKIDVVACAPVAAIASTDIGAARCRERKGLETQQRRFAVEGICIA